MKTSTITIIEYGAVDITAKQDSTLSVSDTQTFSKLSELKRANLQERKYSTLEKNHFVLDGKSENMGESITEVGWWSNSMSDSQGLFSTPLVMTITFSAVHTSIGLTLTFSKYAYCNNLKIQYYDSSNVLISEQTYYPDNYDYFCEGVAENYQKIVITFYSTNIPYRYLKLYKILYGQAVLFEGDNLVSANILEQLNVLSDELSVNTLDFTVYSDDDRFNILNPQGVYATLQEKQQLSVYENKNDELINMGTFYLQNWQSLNNNKMQFKGIDLIGLLDGGTFNGGMYTNVTVEDLLEEIFTSAGLSSESYSIDSSLRNLTLSGYIPMIGHREALQQVLFVIGAVANCARSDIINIYKIEESQTPNEIGRNQIIKGTEEIEQGERITGVLIKSHNYRQTGTEITLFDGQLPRGTHKLIFDEPVFNVTIDTGTLEEYGTNYAIVTVPATRFVAVYGYRYKDNMRDVLIESPNLTGDEIENTLKIDSIYLINDSNVDDIGQRIIDYYDGRYTTKLKHILDDESTGDNVVVQEQFGTSLNGYVTELDIDLTGGYISETKIDAKVVVS